VFERGATPSRARSPELRHDPAHRRAGEIPFITIGSEPSDREGHARVTYAPSLWGTREGSILYRADIQFKAIFARYPLGIDHRLNTAADTLVTGYPGPGGEMTRLWITSSSMRLALGGGGLRLDRHGMKIFGETTLMGEVVRDDELDRYARKLTDRWDEIAGALPEFRAVQGLALATALAFWVRDHRVPVNEAIWTIPDRDGCTPAYVPVVAYIAEGQGIAGGVALTPEVRGTAEGRQFFHHFAGLVDARQQEGGSAWGPCLLLGVLAAGAAAAVILATAALAWLAMRWALRGTGRRRASGGPSWIGCWCWRCRPC